MGKCSSSIIFNDPSTYLLSHPYVPIAFVSSTVFWGSSTVFWGSSTVFWEVALFFGKQHCFLGKQHCFFGEVTLFFGEVALFLGKQHCFWGKQHCLSNPVLATDLQASLIESKPFKQEVIHTLMIAYREREYSLTYLVLITNSASVVIKRKRRNQSKEYQSNSC